MVKKILKKIIHNIVSIGMQEHLLAQAATIKAKNNKNAILNDSVVTGKSARIINQTNDRENIKIGSFSIILGELLTFQHGGNINIGEYVFIGEQSRIWSSNKISIGNRVLISHNVNIHDNNSHSSDIKFRHEEFLYSYKNHKPMPNTALPSKEIIIGDDVWIGFNATILKGVTIGNGAIIGANTLITKNVEAGAIVVGPNEQIIKQVNDGK